MVGFVLGRDQPGGERAPAGGRAGVPDDPDGPAQLPLLPDPVDPRHVADAGRDLCRDSARRRPPEADPQATRCDAVAALAARRLERLRPPPHRPRPDPDHRRRGYAAIRARDDGSLDRRGVLRDPRLVDVHRARLRDRLVHRTEEAANGITQAVQLPMLFLSGIFFPIATMGDALQTVAKFLPLTYLGDALRQVMVDGTPFAPLATCASRCWLPGSSCASGSRPGSSSGSRGVRLDRVVAGRFRRRRRPSTGASARERAERGAQAATHAWAVRGTTYQRSSWIISSSGFRPPDLFGALRAADSAG